VCRDLPDPDHRSDPDAVLAARGRNQQRVPDRLACWACCCCSPARETGGAGIGFGQEIVAIAVFTVIAASTVAVPVIGYLFAADRMRAPLDRLKAWLQDNNAVVMAVLLAVIGVVLIGKGIGGL
jgi:hypothetical protein